MSTAPTAKPTTPSSSPKASTPKPSKAPSYLDPSPKSPSPAGQRAEQSTHRLGERQQRNGHTYELQERGQRHEWVRVDQEQGGSPDASGKGQGGPIDSGGSGRSSPEESHAFAKTQLKQISGPAKGVLSAMHASHEGGESSTKNFAPEQLEQFKGWLAQNAGQNVGGGAVRDLGNGSFGFSSPAGAVIVNDSGVHYTAHIGPVQRAMRGEDPFKSQSGQSPSGQSPASQQTSSQPSPGQQTPPDVPGQQTQPQPGAPPRQASPEQMQSVTALMEPQKPPLFRPPVKPPNLPGTGEGAQPSVSAPKTPREAAEHARGELESAVNKWQEALAGGLSPQGNRHWQQYVSARKQIYNNLQKIARDSEPKGAGKQVPMSPLEQLARKSAPEAFQELFKNKDAYGPMYEDMVQQLVEGKGQAKTPARQPSKEQSAMARHGIEPKMDPQAGRRGFEANLAEARGEKPPTVEQRQQDVHRGESWGTEGLGNVHAPRAEQQRDAITAADGPTPATPPSPARGREAMHSRMRDDILKRGFTSEPPPKPDFIEERKPAKPAAGPAKRNPTSPEKLHGMIDRRLAHHGMEIDDSTRGKISDAINAGKISTPKHLESVLKHIQKLSRKPGNEDPAKKAIGRLVNKREGAIASKRTKKSAAEIKAILDAHAESWGIDNREDHRQMLEEMLPDFQMEFEQKKKALEWLMERTGISRRELRKALESGSEDRIVEKMTEATDVTDQFPGLFAKYEYEDTGAAHSRLSDKNEEIISKLLREGVKPVPSITSEDFLAHVDNFLKQNADSAARGGAVGGDDLSAVPFARVRKGFVLRYRNWMKAANAFRMPTK